MEFFPFVIFIFLVVAFSFRLSEVPLTCLVNPVTFSFCSSLKLLVFSLDQSGSLVEYSFSLYHFKNIMPLPSGMQFLLKSQLMVLCQFPCCFSLAAFKILFLNFCHFNYSVYWYGPLGSSCLGLLVLSGPECLFPLPGQGSFQLSCQFFALFSLLLIMQMLVHGGVLSCFNHD